MITVTFIISIQFVAIERLQLGKILFFKAIASTKIDRSNNRQTTKQLDETGSMESVNAITHPALVNQGKNVRV